MVVVSLEISNDKVDNYSGSCNPYIYIYILYTFIFDIYIYTEKFQ